MWHSLGYSGLLAQSLKVTSSLGLTKCRELESPGGE